jgi:hypothetical protein
MERRPCIGREQVRSDYGGLWARRALEWWLVLREGLTLLAGRARNWSGGSGWAIAVADRISLPGAGYRSRDLHAGSLAFVRRDHRGMFGSECASGWH